MKVLKVLLICLMFASATVGQKESTAIPGLVVPRIVVREHVEFGCPAGYQGSYLNLAIGWGNFGGVWQNNSSDSLRVCVTEWFIKELRKANRELEKAQAAELAKPGREY